MKKINKSQIIREHLKNSTDHRPTVVAAAIRSKGVKVSPGLVSVVKHSRRKGFKASRMAHHAEILSQARKFIESAGGVEEARTLIEIVNKIIS